MSIMNRSNGTLIGVAALCTAAILSTGAQAQDTLHVRYVAADLTQPGAAQSLYLRIQRAARIVCHEPDLGDLRAYGLYRQCYEKAIDSAVAKVNATSLTALHRSKTQRSSAS